MKKRENELSGEIVAAAIEVHRALGPGLLESTYETCLAHELEIRRLQFERQKALPVSYKGVRLDAGYRIDLLIEDRVLVEAKAVDGLTPLHEAQVLSYLRLGGWKLGLLINFNVPLLRKGVKRIVLGL